MIRSVNLCCSCMYRKNYNYHGLLLDYCSITREGLALAHHSCDGYIPMWDVTI